MIYTQIGRRLSLSLFGGCSDGKMTMFLLMRGLQLILSCLGLSPSITRLPIRLM